MLAVINSRMGITSISSIIVDALKCDTLMKLNITKQSPRRLDDTGKIWYEIFLSLLLLVFKKYLF